jgi:hypothetical protein
MLRLSALLVLAHHLLAERLSTPRTTREGRREEGTISTEMVVWTVLLIAAAAFAGGVLMNYIRAEAGKIGG